MASIAISKYSSIFMHASCTALWLGTSFLSNNIINFVSCTGKVKLSPIFVSYKSFGVDAVATISHDDSMVQYINFDFLFLIDFSMF